MSFLENSTSIIFLVIMISFGLGSIPFGFILSKVFLGIDPRTIGSGNIGATNVLRTGHKYLAILTLLLDALKGVFAIYLCCKFFPLCSGVESYLAGFCAILGHMYTPWLGFKGGKGAATAAGALFALSWPVGLCTMVTWFLTIIATRYSSLATLIGMIGAPFYAAYYGDFNLVIWCLAVTMIVTLKHKENIYRLIQGRELKFGERKKPKK